MQLKKIITSLAVGVMSFMGVHAQELMPEKLPAEMAPQTLVRAIPPIPAFSLKEILPAQEEVSPYDKFGENVVQTALQYLGARYRRGSMGPKVFDCSGFTGYVYRKRNVSLLRDSRSQYTQGTAIKHISDLKKGDLVFFGGRSNRRSVGHVGIVSEVDPSGKKFSFVHASNQGVKVSKSTEQYYRSRYIGARRIVKD